MISNEKTTRLNLSLYGNSTQPSQEAQYYFEGGFSQIQKTLKALCVKKGLSQYYSKAESVAKRFWSESPMRSKMRNQNLVASASLYSVVRFCGIFYELSDFIPENISIRKFHQAFFQCMNICKDISKSNTDLIEYQKKKVVQFHELLSSFISYWNLTHVKKVQRSIKILADWLIDIIGAKIHPKLVVPVAFSLSVLAMGKYNEFKIYQIAKKSKIAASALNHNIYKICGKIGIFNKKFGELNKILPSQIQKIFVC